MISDLNRLSELHNCDFSMYSKGEVDFVDLITVNVLTKNNLIHIGHILKQYGYYFFKVEAIDDNLIITYFKK